MNTLVNNGKFLTVAATESVMSVIPCHCGGHNCSWPVCPQDCDGRPGSRAHGAYLAALDKLADGQCAEYKRVAPSDFYFENAPAFRKVETVPLANVVFAVADETVVTRQKAKDGSEFTETTSTAKAGDAIVTRTSGDSYAVPTSTFEKNFEINPTAPNQYRSKNFGRAVQVTEDTVIAASWGEDQYIKAGGVIFQNRASNEVYGNQQHSFEGDFAREAKDGSLIRLTESLLVQLAWAEEKGEKAHIADIETRNGERKK